VMDLRWMIALASVIVLEKLWRYGRLLSYAVGVGLLVLAVLAPSHPGLIPGLHAAGGMGGM
jgi:predicted metal-binding membrane protein